MGAAIQASSKKRREATPDINVTPLVDVVLVLLIIFMVIAPALEHGERVELPGVFQPDKTQKGKLDPITVTVGRGGTVYLEKSVTNTEVLPNQLADLREKQPDRRVVLKADGAVDYAKVRDVFAVVQNAGFTGVSLQVSKRGKDQPEEEAN
jgi:biopolymer transport protein ExbD/biopolymer transport protein TolR